MKTQFPIMIIGEAWGEEEARLGMPFVGSAGRELNRMLEEAEIKRSDCYVTNVFNLQPKPTNDIKNLCTDRKGSSIPYPELSKGNYLQDKYWPEVLRLRDELSNVKPNLVIALGNTAYWALTGRTGIKNVRGTVTTSEYPKGVKILPTYHPAAVLRDWSMRPVVVADLMKAKRQMTFPEVRRPKRELWIEPSLNHIELFYLSYVKDKCTKLAWDIETAGADQITCVGFAPSPDKAIVIPFVDNRKPEGSYWPDVASERKAWDLVAKYAQHATSVKVTQNGLYDMNWTWAKVGITPRSANGKFLDTMLKHHALNPEMEKGLAFLGSIYTDEPAWKLERNKGMFTIKRGN